MILYYLSLLSMEKSKHSQPKPSDSAQETELPGAPAYSLEDVRKKFGTLHVIGADCLFQPDYDAGGDKIVISTDSRGRRSSETSALIDFALTPEVAQRLSRQLELALKKWRETQEQ